MTEESIEITDDIRKSEEDGVRIQYYTMDGREPELYMCPGDLVVICNVLHDYASVLREIVDEAGEDMHGFAQATYEYHIKRCKKIQAYIESEIGYSTEEAIEKCRKKQGAPKDDIGEDALVLAMRARKKKKAEQKEPESEKEDEPSEKSRPKDGMAGQIELFDFMEATGA